MRFSVFSGILAAVALAGAHAARSTAPLGASRISKALSSETDKEFTIEASNHRLASVGSFFGEKKDEGKANAKKAKNKSGGALDSAKSKLHGAGSDIKSKASSAGDSIQDKASDFGDSFQSKGKQGKHKAKSAGHDGKNIISRTGSKIKRGICGIGDNIKGAGRKVKNTLTGKR